MERNPKACDISNKIFYLFIANVTRNMVFDVYNEKCYPQKMNFKWELKGNNGGLEYYIMSFILNSEIQIQYSILLLLTLPETRFLMFIMKNVLSAENDFQMRIEGQQWWPRELYFVFYTK